MCISFSNMHNKSSILSNTSLIKIYICASNLIFALYAIQFLDENHIKNDRCL